MTDTSASPLFPEIEPFATHMLEVGNGHTLYVEECGNPHGLPVVVLHGGPGSGCNPKSRRRFNPARYHIICLDQRGCGRSQPAGRLEFNTTPHLVDDLEKIRIALGIEGWVLYGTSWGSTLALAYAQAYPQHVRGMVVGGVFTGSQEELDWLSSEDGLARFRVTEYADLRNLVATHGAGLPMEQALYRMVTGPDAALAHTAAEMFGLYEASACFPETPCAEMLGFFREDPTFFHHILIELHYMSQGLFLEEPLLANCGKLANIPVTILQGALDFVCPPRTAYRLHAALPNSELVIVPTSNHVANDAMEAARIEATNAMATRLG